MYFSTRFCFLSFVFLIISAVANAETKPIEVGKVSWRGKRDAVFFYYDSKTGAFSKSDGKKDANGNLIYDRLPALGYIPNLKPEEIDVYDFNGLAGGYSFFDGVLIRHGNWFSLIDIKKNQAIAPNIGPIVHTHNSLLMPYYFEPNHEGKDSKEFFVFFSEFEPLNTSMETKSSLIPSDDFPSKKVRKVLFAVTRGGEVNWVPLRADIPNEQYQVEVVGKSSLRVSYFGNESHVLEGSAVINLFPSSKNVVTVEGYFPITEESFTRAANSENIEKKVFPLDEIEKTSEFATKAKLSKSIGSRRIIIADSSEDNSKEKESLDKNSVDNSWEEPEPSTPRVPTLPNPPPPALKLRPVAVSEKLYQFQNGNKVVTELTNGYYNVSFIDSKSNKKSSIFTSPRSLRFPVGRSYWSKNQNGAYLANDRMNTAIFISSTGVHVLHQDGEWKTLPMQYSKINKLDQEKSLVAFASGKSNYHVVSFEYAEKHQLKNAAEGLASVGETFLIRDSDASFLRVDYNFHPVFPNAESKIIESVFLSDDIVQVGNSARKIDLRAFDAEMAFEVLPSKYIDIKVTPPNGGNIQTISESPIRLVLSRHSNMSDEQRRKRRAFTVLDTGLEKKIRQALLHPKKGGVVIVGEPGVGKTEAIDTFVADAAEGKFREIPRTWNFIKLSAADLESGTMYTGMYAERALAITEATNQVPLVFITDEIHSLRGGGTSAGQSNDVMNTFKEVLARGRLKMIGTSTSEEFIHAFGGNLALMRRFAMITKEEPKGEDLFKIIESWLDSQKFEKPSREVLSYALTLSGEMNSVGAQPAKVIDLLAQVYSLFKMEGRKSAAEIVDIQNAAVELYRADPSFFDEEKRNQKLDALPAYFEKYLIGMDNAKEAAFNLAEQDYTRVNDRSLPAVRLFFAGPSGAGKTAFGHTVARGLGRSFIRIEMTRYAHALPSDFLREIAQEARKHPFAVICLDEFEKAHKDVQEAILRMLDEGKFTTKENLNGGANAATTSVTISVNNNYFIATSNAAIGEIQELLQGQKKVGFSSSESSEKSKTAKIDPVYLHDALVRAGIAPEILRRFQKIIYVTAPPEHEFRQIIELHVNSAANELEEPLGLKFEFEQLEAFLDGTVKKYYKKNVTGSVAEIIVRDLLRQPLASAIRKGAIKRGDTVKITFNANGVEKVERTTSSCVKALSK